MSEAKIDSPDAEVLDDQPRSVLMALISQLKIGMDLSKVTLPTFILETRSLLQKLTDFFIYGELLKEACDRDDPVERLVALVKWYCSGFSFRPKGVKKPYNPILGEWFRCKWTHSDSSTTHYVAEQVSHHPPISCFVASNRQAGFVINGCVRPKSKFFGNSSAAMLDGGFSVYMLKHNEEYTITFPTYYVRGLLFGTLLMEICGNIVIRCVQTGACAELEFKAKPFFGGEYNVVSGKIKNAKKETVYTINGHWDGEIEIQGKSKKSKEVFWKSEMIPPMKMELPEYDDQHEFESIKLWNQVTKAIIASDQEAATESKSQLEQAQRERIKNQKEGEPIPTKYFELDKDGENWKYKWLTPQLLEADEEPETEVNGVVATNKTRTQ